MLRLMLGLIAAWAAIAAPAYASGMCGAQTHTRFGETRAYFRDVLGACRSDGYCSAVVALADPSGQSSALQQLRVARPAPGAAYQVEVMATTPMPLTAPTPMTFQFGRTTISFADASKLAPQALNEFRIVDQQTADDVVGRLRAGSSMRWTYQSEEGPATAVFPLRGMIAALTWIDCVGRG